MPRLLSSVSLLVLVAATLSGPAVRAQQAAPPAAIRPTENLIVEGIPEIPAGLADEVRRYTEARASGDPFAVVFLDLTVPGGMGGVAAAERILALDPEARLVAASGYVEANTHADLLRRGFRAALEKPFSVRQAAQAVIDALEER